VLWAEEEVEEWHMAARQALYSATFGLSNPSLPPSSYEMRALK